MKFLGLAVASLASAAVAAASTAPVYLLRKTTDSATTATPATPALPRQIVRQILLQRTGAEASGFFDSLPQGYDVDAALDLLDRYGLPAEALFSEREAAGAAAGKPAQLVVLLEGVQDAQFAKLQAALPAPLRQPSFAVADPPSQAAHERLVASELAPAGVTVHRTGLRAALEADTLGGYVGLFDVAKDADVLAALVEYMAPLVDRVETGDFEVTLVLLLESSRASKLAHWTTKGQRTPSAELHARTAASEAVMVEATEETSETTETSEPSSFEWAATAATVIPACFQSFNSCVAQTGNCSGHGACYDKYAYNSGGAQREGAPAAASSCFVCHCYSTLNHANDETSGRSTTQWAGAVCERKDISAPFWLLTGFSVTLVGVLSLAIGMLFNVGEEKLPGVIGAGVSRSK